MLSDPLLSGTSTNRAREAMDAVLPPVLPRRAGRHPLPTHLALRLALFVCCSIVLLFVSARAAQANAIIVMDAGDTPSDGCTLREAIINANNDDQSGSMNCAAGSGDDTITFHAVLAGSTITLISGPLTLTSNIGIFGSGVITVSGDNTSRVFDTTGGFVTLSGLTVRDGNADDGGAVRTVNGALSLIDTVVISNTASGYGGGLFLQTSTAEISGTQFISNVAGVSGGGAAVMTMTLQLLNTDFMSNTAKGLGVGDGGGGLWSNDAITQTGGTYQGNVTGRNGGGLLASGGYELTDVNFLSNIAAREGGGTHQFSITGPLPSSITGGTFQANRANSGSGGGIYAYANPLVISGTLILSNTATGSGGGVFNYSRTRIINVRLENNNARAVYSQNALEIIGSHFLRSSGGSGAGAFSNGGGVNVSDSSFVQTTSTDSGGVLFVNSGAANITNTIFLSSTGGTGGAIFVSGGSLTVSDSRFENGKSTGPGGAIFSNSSIILNNTDFISNTSTNTNIGGAVFGPVTVTGGRFERNSANAGGAIWAQGSSALISGTLFISNTARNGGGGAVWGGNLGTALTITNTTFTGNVANALGGGALWTDAVSLLDNVTFTDNAVTVANAGGGALWADNTTVIRNSTFMSNTSAGWAGALFLQNTFTLSNTTFIANAAAAAGGGLARGGPGSIGAGLIVNSLFARNTAGGRGAAIAIETSGPVQIVFTTIGNASPLMGAAIAVSNTSQAYITNTIISGYDVGISQGGGATVSEDYNLFFDNHVNTAGTVSSGGHSLTDDPAFADVAADDYRLTVPSPAIGGGVDQGIYTDYFGDARPQLSGADNGFDIGFDEFAYTYDVALAKSVTPATVLPGGPLTYTLHFSSTESGKVLGIVIDDTIPASVTVTAITSSTMGSGIFITQTSGGPLPSAGEPFTWAVNELDMGEGGVITITGVVSTSEAVAGTLFNNTATITATYDLTDTNNVGAASVQVKPYHTIGGVVSGLAGSGLVLQNNGGDDLTVSTNGAFTFATPQVEGTTYAVTVLTQPSGPLQECTVASGSGTVADDNITNVAVTCSTVTYTLDLAEVGEGTATADPALTDYPDGTIVTLTATPATGYAFSGWSGDVDSLLNTVTVTMDEAKIVTATFSALAAAIEFAQTVGVDPSTCASGVDVTVFTGNTIYYCYTVRNAGEVTLTNHTLEQSALGVIFTDLAYELTPGETTDTVQLGQIVSQTVTISSSTVATWTAAVATLEPTTFAINEDVGAVASADSTITVADAALTVQITVGSDASGCATTQNVIVPAGTQVYFCVTLANTGAVTLTDFTLQLTPGDVEFPSVTLAPGETIQFTDDDTALLGPITVDRLISMGVTIEAVGDGAVLGRFMAQSQADSTAALQPTDLEPDKQPEDEGIQRFFPWLAK